MLVYQCPTVQIIQANVRLCRLKAIIDLYNQPYKQNLISRTTILTNQRHIIVVADSLTVRHPVCLLNVYLQQ